MADPLLLTAYDVPPSPARVDPPFREPLRLALVQQSWHADPEEHRDAIAAGSASRPPKARGSCACRS